MMFKGRKYFTWNIHYSCNYRCTYCFFNGIWEKKSEENVYPGPDRWTGAWDAVYAKYGSCIIHMSGAEPSVYPSFAQLVSRLSEKHRVGVDTNMSFDAAGFAGCVKNTGNVFFTPSFHPEFAGAAEYIEKLDLLKNAGCQIGYVNYVGYPPHLSEAEKYHGEFSKRGYIFMVLPYRGEFNGSMYPEGYTEKERKLLMVGRDPRERAAIRDTRTKMEWKESEPKTNQGKQCLMGSVYAVVYPDGTAYRCCSQVDKKDTVCLETLGNLLEGSFSFYDGARVCSNTECSCPTAMVEGNEKSWTKHWEGRYGYHGRPG
ncbi:MAG: radical SAM protein [Elusimicrobia bacterium]|nr:radical SAM protein [Elusimicrobiota bacterium]